MTEAWAGRLKSRSVTALANLENGLDRIVIGWLLVAGLACGLRLFASALPLVALSPGRLLPYALLVIAPAASLVLALRWFSDVESAQQPTTRLALVGQWRRIGRSEAQAHSLYGTSGIMVSLLFGMLLNIPLRAAEYLAVMPPVPMAIPSWLATLQLALTFDVALFTSLYAIAFVAALRKAPLFPRLLLVIWVFDLAAQIGIARMVMSTAPPAEVASALQGLLEGNINKVLISMALWLPYLLLSTRVNVTYRHRVRD